jgi:hypothetical protein
MMVVWFCVILGLRLYALVVSLLVLCEGGSVCVSDLGEALIVVVVSRVCSTGAVDLCVLGGVGFMVGATGRT